MGFDKTSIAWKMMMSWKNLTVTCNNSVNNEKKKHICGNINFFETKWNLIKQNNLYWNIIFRFLKTKVISETINLKSIFPY